jgi:hypothetical protein
LSGGHPQLFQLAGPLCDRCIHAEICGAQLTTAACRSEIAHEYDYHPLNRATTDYIERQLRGTLGFDDIAAQPAVIPELPPFVAQIRFRTALRGHLAGSIYGIRADGIVTPRRGDCVVRSAPDLRAGLGLSASQHIAVIFFVRDKLLEACWPKRSALAHALAEAGFDLVIAPSYSTYTPRSRTDHLIELRRSMLFYEALQNAGLTAIPRLGWVVPFDVERFARWSNSQGALTHVAVDMQTIRHGPHWQGELELLRAFDRQTGRRLHYLINGPGTNTRLRALARVLGTRATITHARMLGPPLATATPSATRGERFARDEHYWLAECSRALNNGSTR